MAPSYSITRCTAERIGRDPGLATALSRSTPDAPFLTEGERTITYAAFETERGRVARELGVAFADRSRPIVISGGNDIHHAADAACCLKPGYPGRYASPAYASCVAAPWTKLQKLIGSIDPFLILADDPVAIENALAGLSIAASVHPLQQFAMGGSARIRPSICKTWILVKGERRELAPSNKGCCRIGGARRFADPEDPWTSIVFDGRVTENFKLSTGTFVNVGALRLSAISVGEKLIFDVVVVGEGCSDLGPIVFRNDAVCRDLLGEEVCRSWESAVAHHPQITQRLAELLRGLNATAMGSSMQVARFIVADGPPDPHREEITDKGYVNQRRVIANRIHLVEQLYREGVTL